MIEGEVSGVLVVVHEEIPETKGCEGQKPRAPALWLLPREKGGQKQSHRHP